MGVDPCKQVYNLSFAGCGFLGVYHIGVACAVKEFAPHLLLGKISGASAGSVAATALVCDICLGEGTSNVLKIVKQARSRVLGPLHPDFDLMQILRDGLLSSLPPNAHEICSGRLHISLTRFSDGKNVIVSDFRSKEELVQRYIDGGWSDNLVRLDEHTLTVSPFSGESDICPQDNDSASFLDFSMMNTSIRFNARNLYRFSFALFPPHPETLSELCRQGFRDMLKFLATRNLISCTRCISVRSSIRLPMTEEQRQEEYREPAGEVPPQAKLGAMPDLIMTSLHKAESEIELEEPPPEKKPHFHLEDCETCEELGGGWKIHSLPLVVRETLAYSENLEKTALAYILNSRPGKVLSYVALPWIVPVDFTFAASLKFLRWLPSLPKDLSWFISRAVEALSYIFSYIEMHRHRYSARFSCQLAVTDYNFGNTEPVGLSRVPSRKISNTSRATIASRGAYSDNGASTKTKGLNFGFTLEVGGSSLQQPARSAAEHLADLTNRDSVETAEIPTAEFARSAKEFEINLLEQQARHLADQSRHGSADVAGPSSDFIGPDLIQSESMQRDDSSGHLVHSDEAAGREVEISDRDLDAFESVLEFAREHEALLSWYYLDDDNKVRVNEIFGLSEEEQTHLESSMASRAHSRQPSRHVSRRPSLNSLRSSHACDS